MAPALQLHDDIFPSAENKKNTSEAFNNVDKRATLAHPHDALQKISVKRTLSYELGCQRALGEKKRARKKYVKFIGVPHE